VHINNHLLISILKISGQRIYATNMGSLFSKFGESGANILGEAIQKAVDNASKKWIPIIREVSTMVRP
jgi:hypothetical protein